MRNWSILPQNSPRSIGGATSDKDVCSRITVSLLFRIWYLVFRICSIALRHHICRARLDNRRIAMPLRRTLSSRLAASFFLALPLSRVAATHVFVAQQSACERCDLSVQPLNLQVFREILIAQLTALRLERAHEPLLNCCL